MKLRNANQDMPSLINLRTREEKSVIHTFHKIKKVVSDGPSVLHKWKYDCGKKENWEKRKKKSKEIFNETNSFYTLKF